MTVRKGEAWGSIGRAPADMVTVDGDAALRRIVEEALSAGRRPPPVGLVGGDLMRAVGGSGDVARYEGDVALLPVDLVRLQAAGASTWCCSHLVARRRWWRGEVVAVMNAQHLGAWDVAPRAHPGDGRIDVVRVDPSMSWRDRLRARSRLVHGTHLPHPCIEVRQHAEVELDFGRAMSLIVDDEPWVTASSVRVVVVPDALTVVV